MPSRWSVLPMVKITQGSDVALYYKEGEASSMPHHFSVGWPFFEVSNFLFWIPINGDTSINLLYYLKLNAIKEMILKYHSQLTETLASHILQC